MQRAEKQLQVQRMPLPDGLDGKDPQATRAWLIAAMEQEISVHGALGPAMLVFLPDAQVIVETGGLFDVGEHEFAAATFRALAEWRDAVRAYREGEVVMPVDGQLRRMAALLEVGARPQDGEEAWWATWRPIGTGDGGVGVLHGGWATAEGVGLESVPEALQEWLDAGDKAVRLGGMKFQSAPVPPLNVRMCQGRFAQPVPTSADHLAAVIGQGFDQEVLQRGLDCLVLFAFRGADWERWEIRGELSCELDDVVRAIAQWSNPEAVVLVSGIVGEFHGAQRRAVSALAEVGGRRFERALPLTFGPDGRPSPMPWLGRWHGDPTGVVPQEDRWIGTPPKAEVDVTWPVGQGEPQES